MNDPKNAITHHRRWFHRDVPQKLSISRESSDNASQVDSVEHNSRTGTGTPSHQDTRSPIISIKLSKEVPQYLATQVAPPRTRGPIKPAPRAPSESRLRSPLESSVPGFPFQFFPSGPQHPPANGGGFAPMNTWHFSALDAGSEWSEQLKATGASPFYRGNPFLEANQSANIPPEENTALWLTNLPPTCTHRDLLGAIRDCGKVYATVINPPEQDARFPPGARPTHTTSASKLVFFDRAGADRLAAQARAGRFAVGGYVPKVRPNRIQSAPRDAGPQCRVLHIDGPSALVNEPFLHGFFRTKFAYELEAVRTLAVHGDVTRQEWRFGSFRCQAESARQSINREKERLGVGSAGHGQLAVLNNLNDPTGELRLWSRIVVYFGVDPCDRY
ncbi:hypothetical protein Hte_007797 [Hypoxylon texense]